jgi:hypothetical protein
MIEKRARARKAPAGKAREEDAGKALRFGPTLIARLDALAAFTEIQGQLTRRYLTPAHVAAMGQVRAWMEEAGMAVRVDAVCNIIGRYEAKQPGAPAILLGSHIDTVVDAGKYDGNLGVLAAVAAVGDLGHRGERLDHAIEAAIRGHGGRRGDPQRSAQAKVWSEAMSEITRRQLLAFFGAAAARALKRVRQRLKRRAVRRCRRDRWARARTPRRSCPGPAGCRS